MNNRAYTIDVLRCLAIVGMVLSGQIFWNPELPSWLFHAQIPPPAFVFDPTVPGITWVDLVFPFFLFSMGAAFPLAMRGKIERGVSGIKIGGDVLKRALLLALFAIALANTRIGVLGDSTLPEVAKNLLVLTTWGLFFAMFVRLKSLSSRANNLLNGAGVAALIGQMVIYKFGLGLNVTIMRSDIIILILANMALFGSLVWWLTRESILLRLGIVAIIVVLKISSSVDGSWTQAVWNYSPAPWLYRAEFLKYLCIVLPGSVAGDWIYRWVKERQSAEPVSNGGRTAASLLVMTLMFCVNMWGLFTRNTEINFVATLILGSVACLLMRKAASPTQQLHRNIFLIGFFYLILGLIIEPFEGGIKKDSATISYFFVTSGLASVVVVVVSALINFYKVNLNLLVKCGQNPMIAYTASGYVILPLLTLLHLSWILQLMIDTSPWLGALRGAVVTLLMIGVTYLFTKNKIFWKT